MEYGPFSFFSPSQIVFGNGESKRVGIKAKELGAKAVLIVTDKGIIKAGLADDIKKVLMRSDIDVTIFDEVDPNPSDKTVEKGERTFREGEFDLIIGLGGGSSMDTAKAIKAMAMTGEPLLGIENKWLDENHIKKKVSLFVIPTTAGTGSEVTEVAVIKDKKRNKKLMILGHVIRPEMAFCDPLLTVSLPPKMTAATGIDALTHALEAYFAPDYHPICDGIGVEAIRLVVKYLPIACKNGDDLEAREQMQLAASMGAIAFQKGLGMVHSLAHPLSAEYDTHHGLANALLLPDSVALIEDRARTEDQLGRIQRVRQLFAEQGYRQNSLAATLQQFVSDVGITPGLGNHGVPEKDLENLSRLAFEDGIHKTNMVPVTQDDLLSVYCAAFD
jgi:4-hydroxybutyrate dehydrogenase